MDERTRDSGPDLSLLGALIGEPARAKMLSALMGGRALTATELSLEGDVAPSTASAHLAKLAAARLVRVIRQGRHRYFQIADDDVAGALETLAGLAAREDIAPRRPTDPRLAAARVCYDHLAGTAGVWMTERMRERNLIGGRDAFTLAPDGERFFEAWGIDVAALARSRRPLCRTCLDWSERRFHLGGSLGAAILERLFALRWARREPDSRAVAFSPSGERSFRALFGAEEHAARDRR
ncbi:MAG TPA: helix-turn-helix domain-containing protein [Thermoanaerobaculia bacterium]